MNIRSVTCLALLLAMTALALSCGVKGEFGFKRFGDDTYSKIGGTPEFASDEEISWVFLLKKKYSERDIGIVCQKKELVWVDVLTRVQRITPTDRAIYGTIKDFQPGEYHLILTLPEDDNDIIDSKDFIVYDREDEEE
jgi:hypothetical protein